MTTIEGRDKILAHFESLSDDMLLTLLNEKGIITSENRRRNVMRLLVGFYGGVGVPGPITFITDYTEKEA